MHILTVLGARPQFIKATAVSQAIRKTLHMHETLLHTGQHFDANMSTVFFDELDIPAPKFSLNIHGGTHGEMTARMLIAIEHILMETRPDIVLVYGDTNSTLAGTLAAVKLQLPVAHVEAGLRSFNRRMPEEINRILTDHAASRLFAPTQSAVDNLRNEGISGDRVCLVGDVMYDVALHFRSIALQRSEILLRMGLQDQAYVLCTVHRAENTDDGSRLNNILNALNTLSAEIRIVLPLHPRTRNILDKAGFNWASSGRLMIIEPVGYLDMVRLEASATLIATDSGGVQKEAFFNRVPCVTLREETEWVELVDAGWNRLTSPDRPDEMLDALRNAIGSVGQPISPYGAGDAASLIIHTLAQG